MADVKLVVRHLTLNQPGDGGEEERADLTQVGEGLPACVEKDQVVPVAHAVVAVHDLRPQPVSAVVARDGRVLARNAAGARAGRRSGGSAHVVVVAAGVIVRGGVGVCVFGSCLASGFRHGCVWLAVTGSSHEADSLTLRL